MSQQSNRGNKVFRADIAGYFGKIRGIREICVFENIRGRVRWAKWNESPFPGNEEVELSGIEPLTSSLRTTRSTN